MSKSNEHHDPLLSSTMSLGDHLEELRTRIIRALLGLAIGMVACLFFGNYLIKIIQKPYSDLTDIPLSVLGPPDAFLGYMKVSLIAGLILSSPWVFYQLWLFVAAGLYPKEKKYVKIAVPFSAILFVAGAVFFLLVVAPLALGFFIRFGEWVNVKPNWTFQKYITFVTTLMLVFGIAFQTPIAIFFLNKTGLISLKALRQSRRYVILGIVIISAIVTPPDVVSQVLLSLPLYLLYELGILISAISTNKKK